jgi:hypothetical protein
MQQLLFVSVWNRGTNGGVCCSTGFLECVASVIHKETVREHLSTAGQQVSVQLLQECIAALERNMAWKPAAVVAVQCRRVDTSTQPAAAIVHTSQLYTCSQGMKLSSGFGGNLSMDQGLPLKMSGPATR